MKKTLLFIFLLSLLLRLIFVFNNSISFHYDMSRDAFAISEIWKNHELKVLGPPSSQPGLFHGVFYYYLLAPFYALGNGNPQIPAIFMSILNSLAIIPLYLLAKTIFKEKKWIIISLLLLVFSYEAIQYGVWLSNPAPAFLSVAFYFYGLKLWEKNNKMGLYLAVLSAAISTQFQLFLIYLFPLLIIFRFMFKTKVHFRQVAISMVMTLAILSSYLISLIKFNLAPQFANIFFGISSSYGIGEGITFSSLMIGYINRLADLFTNNFFPVNLFIGGLLGFIVIIINRKEKFLLFCLFSNLFIYLFGGHSASYANVGLVIPAILLVVLTMKDLEKRKIYSAYLFISIMILANIFVIIKNFNNGQISLVIPKGMVLSEQLRLIDKTYEIANGQPFSINSLTLPLWTNTTWVYLYNWYGLNKYGYLPSFYGHDQIGIPGDKIFEQVSKPAVISFFIMEPKDGIREIFWQNEIDSENGKTILKNEYTFGDLKLQFRSLVSKEGVK